MAPFTDQPGAAGWFQLACSDGTPRKAFGVAVVVGIILNAINQGDAFVTGAAVNWLKIGLTFLVPYCVATYGAVTAKQALARHFRK